jgi:hypothetical protein
MEALRLEGYFCFKVHGNEYVMAGVPDIMVCAQGLFIGLETKNPENRNGSTPEQKLRAKQIRDAGGAAYVVCSPQEALAVAKAVIAKHVSKA